MRKIALSCYDESLPPSTRIVSYSKILSWYLDDAYTLLILIER